MLGRRRPSNVEASYMKFPTCAFCWLLKSPSASAHVRSIRFNLADLKEVNHLYPKLHLTRFPTCTFCLPLESPPSSPIPRQKLQTSSFSSKLYMALHEAPLSLGWSPPHVATSLCFACVLYLLVQTPSKTQTTPIESSMEAK